MADLDKPSESAKTISFVHHKGGTGKTTACINIAGWLSKMNKNVLVTDLDPQGNATTGLGVERKSVDYSMYDVLFGGKKMQDIILETSCGVHLAPSSIDLLAAETHLAGMPNQTALLKKHFGDIEKYYDYILIDLPPGSTMLMINGIIAAEKIIIPLDAGVFAYETMETLRILLRDISKELHVDVNIMCVLLREDPVVSLSLFPLEDPAREIRKLLKEFLSTYCTEVPEIFMIPYSHKIYKSQKKGIPISHYAPWSNIGRTYKRIAKEVENY